VAIKVFRPELAETLGVERFTREIRTAANLQHPHILTVHDSGVADGLLYYVMPFVDGESLRARVEREGGLPVADVVRILREVADALAFAHQHGVVHRDIKPDNVLLSGRHALVADFGVAKAISEATGRQALTTIGVALGTPAYMAPEQAAADPHLDHRVDIYALGVLGYELLVGEPPFVRRTVQQVIAAHMTELPPPVTQRRPAVPPALDSLIARCLAKQRGDRWQTADEVVAELERLSTPTAGIAPTLLPPVTSQGVPRSPSGRRRTAAIAAAGIALAALSWVAVSKIRGGTASPTDGNVVAVLPFEFSATPDLVYLREGIVNVLEANLTGEGGPRAVASQTAIAQWKRRGGDTRGLTEDEAREAARALGAASLIRGSIVGTSSNLIVSATLVPSSSGGEPVRASQSGPADSIASIASRLATQLLSLRAGEGADRTASLQVVPPAALRAYLEGQQAYRAARYGDAVAEFGRALSIDSTFALAGIGHAMATGFNISTYGTSDGLQIAYRNRATLGPRDLILLEMATPSSFAGRPISGRESVTIREQLVLQIPDRPEAWYLLGDMYAHWGQVYGFTPELSRSRADNAFRRALALDPGIEYLRGHLADMAFTEADDTRYSHLVDSLHLDLPYHRLTKAIYSGDSAEVRRIQSGFDQLGTDALIFAGMYAGWSGAATVADDAFRKVRERSAGDAERRGLLRAIRGTYAMMGRPSGAARAREQLRALEDDGVPAFPEDDIYEAVIGDGDTLAATRAVQTYERRIDLATTSPTPSGRVAAWLTGFWAAHRGDSVKTLAAIRYLDAVAQQRDTTGVAAQGRLYADILRIVSRTRPPAREVVERADSILRDGPPIGAARMAMNIVVARSWERLGEPQRAAAAATRLSPFDLTFSMDGPAMRERGRMLLAAGDTAGAIRAWRMYLRPRAAADPAQRTDDDAIRKQLALIERVKR
jgi:TolB-like protein